MPSTVDLCYMVSAEIAENIKKESKKLALKRCRHNWVRKDIHWEMCLMLSLVLRLTRDLLGLRVVVILVANFISMMVESRSSCLEE